MRSLEKDKAITKVDNEFNFDLRMEGGCPAIYLCEIWPFFLILKSKRHNIYKFHCKTSDFPRLNRKQARIFKKASIVFKITKQSRLKKLFQSREHKLIRVMN